MFAEAFFEKTNQQVVSKPGTWVAVTVRVKRRLTGAEDTTVTQGSGEIDLSAGLSPCASRVCRLGLWPSPDPSFSALDWEGSSPQIKTASCCG